MRSRPRRGKVWVLGLIALCALVLSSVAAADPPMRVARLAHINGAVSFSPAGEEEWVQATVNRPLITGDRVWVDAGARAELQFGGAAIRLGSSTSVVIINLDDRVAQFQLAQGTVNVRVRRLGPDDVVEVDTPQLAFTMRRAAEVRIDVDAQGATSIAMRSGEGEVWGESAAYTIAAGQWYRFVDSALRNYQSDAIPAPDDFDRWAYDRDRREDGAVTARYVAPEVIGYSDLDDYGSWSAVENYGNVWFPAAVPSGWAPYRYGRWAWIEPWGWTWVDDAPWGFAPFHYGRWAYLRERWCWVPGPVRARPVYAPALVAFVGGGNVRLGAAAGLAWFPLGPGEIYRPSYRVSRGYFTNINVSNTQINNTYVTNVYNNAGAASASYQHQHRPNAVTAVPTSAFVQSRPVAQAAVAVAPETIARAPATPFAAIAPTRASLAAAGAAAPRPPGAVLERRVVARTPPPPAAAPFAARQQGLARDPGRPLDPAATAALAPAVRAPAAPVKLVTPAQTGALRPAPQTPNRAGVPPTGESARTGAPPPQAAPPLGARPPPPATTPNAPPTPAPSAGAPPPVTTTRTAPPAANAPPPRPPGVPPQPAISASPPSGPTPVPPNAPAFAPARPAPPSAAGEAAVPAPPPATIARPPVPQPAPATEVKRVPPPPPTAAPAPPPATIARPPPQPAPATEVKRVPPPPPPTAAPAPPPATVARPPAPQPAPIPAPEIRRGPLPPQIAAPPAGAKPEGRDSPRQEEGKAKQEEKKQDVK